MSAPLSPRLTLVPRKQAGVTLIIAIVFLLVITVLGISSMRGVSLESRITANLKQQKALIGAAEAGLRIGENCDTLKELALPVADTNIDTPPLFTAANAAKVATLTTEYATKIQWYAIPLGPLGPSIGNNAATGEGLHYFEINACASTVLCTSDTTTRRIILRSVLACSK
ncbi:MAG: pilus assembly PilX family protein [Pseudomonas sp.]|jgi:type IV pilus assembly protein PilX